MISAILLAAGKGERMWPLSSTRPKPLLPVVLGKSLLERWVEDVTNLVDEVIVVASDDRVAQKSEEMGAKVAYQRSGSGTATAVKYGLEKAKGDLLLIAYTDIYLQYPKENLEELLKKTPSILVKEVEDVSQFGAIIEESGKVKGIVEKGMKGKGKIFAGVAILKRRELEEGLKYLKPSPRGELELTDLIPEQEPLPVTVKGFWKDVGRPWDIFDVVRAEFEVREGFENPWGPGKIYGELPKVKGEVYIEGPAYFDKGVEVGPFAHVRPYSAFLEGVKVGSFVQVKNSYIMEGSKIPHLNYVGDSVIAEDVNMGAGSVTANLRFDEKTIKVKLKGETYDTGLRKLGAIIGGGARIGVNASLMPGVRIGAGSWIYPGCVVYRDVKDHERFKC